MIDVSKYSAEELTRMLRENPELLKQVTDAMEKRDQLYKEVAEKRRREYLAKKQAFLDSMVGAVITKVEEISDSDYEYSGETHVYTDKGKIVIDGTIDKIGDKQMPDREEF